MTPCKTYYVYLLFASDEWLPFYAGLTTDLATRIHTHKTQPHGESRAKSAKVRGILKRRAQIIDSILLETQCPLLAHYVERSFIRDFPAVTLTNVIFRPSNLILTAEQVSFEAKTQNRYYY
jgi:hypothetical protein